MIAWVPLQVQLACSFCDLSQSLGKAGPQAPQHNDLHRPRMLRRPALNSACATGRVEQKQHQMPVFPSVQSNESRTFV